MMSLAAWLMYATEEFAQHPRPDATEEAFFKRLDFDMFQDFESDWDRVARESSQATDTAEGEADVEGAGKGAASARVGR
jgi:hypothetical protein